MRGWFVAGTDTGVGKTYCCELLIGQLVAEAKNVAAFKPVASGATVLDGKVRNDDALRLMRAANSGLHYEDINPYCFADPISPHWAAAKAGMIIDIPRLAIHIHAKARGADFTIVEGVGGWYAPLTENETAADLAQALGLPVILVVGLRVGCLNHALLTADAIVSSGALLAGWIGNVIDPDYGNVAETEAYLTPRLGAPYLGIVPYGPSDAALKAGLRLELGKLK